MALRSLFAHPVGDVESCVTSNPGSTTGPKYEGISLFTNGPTAISLRRYRLGDAGPSSRRRKIWTRHSFENLCHTSRLTWTKLELRLAQCTRGRCELPRVHFPQGDPAGLLALADDLNHIGAGRNRRACLAKFRGRVRPMQMRQIELPLLIVVGGAIVAVNVEARIGARIDP